VSESLTLDSVLIPSENVVARVIEGEMIIIPLTAGIGEDQDELYSLNETGQAIWQALDGKKSLRQLLSEIAQEYEVDEAEMEKDVLGLANELLQRKMISLAGQS